MERVDDGYDGNDAYDERPALRTLLGDVRCLCALDAGRSPAVDASDDEWVGFAE